MYFCDGILYYSKNVKKTKPTKKIEEKLENFGSIEDFNYRFSTNYETYEELINAIHKLEWWNDELQDIFGESKEVYYLYETPKRILFQSIYNYTFISHEEASLNTSWENSNN